MGLVIKMLAMKYIIRIFLLHFFIFAVYIIITSYMFVTYRDYDPVGMGLQQWCCFIVHLLLTGIISWVIVMKSKDKSRSKKMLATGLCAVICWWVLYLLISGQFQHLLDRLRG